MTRDKSKKGKGGKKGKPKGGAAPVVTGKKK